MDRNIQLRHLAEAEEHIASGERHIADQILRIEEFDLRGYDATLARSLLTTFRHIQVQHLAHRDQILKELAVSE